MANEGVGACPTWDGRFESFEHYKALAEACSYTFKAENRAFVTGRLFANLREYAFELVQEYDRTELDKPDGATILLPWLDKHIKKEPTYLLLDRIREYFFKDSVHQDITSPCSTHGGPSWHAD